MDHSAARRARIAGATLKRLHTTTNGLSTDMHSRWFMLGLAGVAGTAFAAVGDPPGIDAHRLWVYAHLLVFVFWLGADLGAFLCARAAANPALTPEQRSRTLELMRSIDLAPRIAASLMLTVGGVLTEYVGIPHPWWQFGGIVALAPVWLMVVLLGHFRQGTSVGLAMLRLDEGIRALLVVAVPASVYWSWSTGRLAAAPYVAAKLLLFALVMLVGLLLRRRGVGAPGLERSGPELLRVHRRTVPLVIAIWTGLAIAALLGIAKPGAPVIKPATPLAAAGGAGPELPAR